MSSDLLDAMLLLINAIVGDDTVSVASDLTSGVHFYSILAKAAPHAFPEDGGLKAGSLNWILKKSNLQKLCGLMTQFARTHLSAPPDFNLEDFVDITAIAKNDDLQEAHKLAMIVITEMVLANNPIVVQTLRGLPSSAQAALSGPVKGTKAKYDLKKAKGGEAADRGGSPSMPNDGTPAAVSPTAPSSASPVTLHAAGPTAGHSRNAIKIYDENSDDSPIILKGEITQLRDRIATLTRELELASSKAEMAQKQYSEVHGNYKRLLEETQAKGLSTKEREWMATVAEREERIAALSANVTALSSKCDGYKQELEKVHEAQATQQHKIGDLEEQVFILTEERAELQSKLQFESDKAEVNANARERVEEERDVALRELEKLRAPRTPSKKDGKRGIQQQQQQQGSSGEDDDDDATPEELRERTKALREKLDAAEGKLRLLSQAGRSGSASAVNADELQDELASARDQIASLEREKAVLAGLLQEEKERAKSASAHAAQAATAELQARLDELGVEVREHKARIEQLLHDNERERKAAIDAEKARMRAQTEQDRLEDELTALKQHQHRRNSEVDAPPHADLAARLEEIEILRTDNMNLQQRIEVGREAMKKEQTVLVSCLVDFGQRNLLLQQNSIFGRCGGSSLTASRCVDDDEFPDEDETFLAKGRRRAERGLLERIAAAATAGHGRRH